MSGDDATPIRKRRPTADETDLALLRAAIQQQSQMMASIHTMLVQLADEIATIKSHLEI